MLREGLPTARFTAQECINSSVSVVDEFLLEQRLFMVHKNILILYLP